MEEHMPVIMTLDKALQELERQGFGCEFLADDQLVGEWSQCHWDVVAKIDIHVFVFQVPGILTLDRLTADRQELPYIMDQRSVGGQCPPFGASRARQKLMIYYAEAIAPEVQHVIEQVAPAREWCSVTFVAAQDSQGRSYSLANDKTPFWGRAFFPELRYRAGKLLGRPIDELEPPRRATWIRYLNWFSLIYILFLSFQLPWLPLLLLALLALQFLVAGIMEWCKRGKRQKQKQPQYPSTCGLLSVDNGHVENELHVS